MKNEVDKYKNQKGRIAAEEERDGQFLNQESLEDDLIDVDDEESTEGPGIVNSENPDSEEWNVREFQNNH